MVIAGPTGSGKSSLALTLAETFRGEIVNCDSMQLYKGFDIGTAKVPASERRSIPHHMIDVLTADESYSAGDYARDARRVIRGIAHLPVVTGGTGFYVRALLEGLPSLPSRDEALRARLIDRESKRAGSIHRILTRLDPSAAARIHVRDTQKTIRALEIRILTGASAPPAAGSDPLTGYNIVKIGLDPDRAQLYEALDARTREMFRSGLIEEVRWLLASGLSGNEKPFESLGYKQALESTVIETRQYAKRQWTWFRKDAEMFWLRGFGNEASVIEQSIAHVRPYVPA